MRLPTTLLDPRNAPAAILAASIIVLGTALASQYWGGLAPCKRCRYQRWPYGITIALSGIAMVILRGVPARRLITALCALAFAVGGGIAFYHAGVEQGWFTGPSSCTAPGIEAQTIEELKRQLIVAPIVRCDEIPWSLLGISMAGYNAIASIVLAIASAVAAFRMERGGRGHD